jgi:hypothetical protein
MKKQLTILLLFLFNCAFIYGQTFVKTDIPCDKELLKKTPGRWMPLGKVFFRATISKQQQQEIEKRLNPIHQWVANIYPSPMAFDAKPFFSAVDRAFASQLEIERDQYGTRSSPVGGIPTISSEYSAGFCAYHCGRTNYEIMPGAGCETGTSVNVTTNTLDQLLIGKHLEDFEAEIMQVDNRPIKMMYVSSGIKWKGQDIYIPRKGSGYYFVLLHRDGMLPYIPVTRKQYLDKSIECLQKFFEKIIKSYENPVGLPSLMDKKEKDKQVKIQQKFRDDVLKYYNDELAATTKAGLLDSPAVVFDGMLSMSTQYPIFTTQAEGGNLLVIENPAYFKKDLPKYIPQLIIFSMWNAKDGPDPEIPYKFYYQDFPIEKLKAMIDK